MSSASVERDGDAFIRVGVLLHGVIFSLLFLGAYAGSDLRALLEFKKGIRGDPTGVVLSTWVPRGGGGCPASFHGVSCDPSGGGVVAIALDSLALSGDIHFATLAGLRALRNLSLAGNSLSGRLPPAIGSLASLARLDLSANRFYGPLPGRLTELRSLAHLNLSANNFSGGLLAAGFHNLQQLAELDLSSNSFRGDVAVLLPELQNVVFLDLSNNRFHGSLANLSSLAGMLKHVNLSGNIIDGGFFSSESMRLLRSLEVLDVTFNRISGQLPSFDGLSSLRVLRTGSNQLFGPIPEELFESAMPLEEIDLSGNAFTGYVHSVNSTTLKNLNLSSNALSGSLPSELRNCVSVDLSKNMLSGDLSATQNWSDTLQVLDLSSNLLSGSFPDKTSGFASLISFKIRNNSLGGNLPSSLGSYQMLSIIDLSLNEFTGPILSSLLTLSTMTVLNLSGNQFTGSIPLSSLHATKSVELPSGTHVESLDLSDNQLSGSLPPAIGNMQRLKLLNLANNILSGELPSELSNLSGLEVLDLSNNHFKGRIPEMDLLELEVFNVSYNDLSGDVPKSLERFPMTSFHPGNAFLLFPDGEVTGTNNSGFGNARHTHVKSGVRVKLIFGSIGMLMLLVCMLILLYKIKSQRLCGKNGFKSHISENDANIGNFNHPNMLRTQKKDPELTSFSNELLLTSASRSMSAEKELVAETKECGYLDSKEGVLGSLKPDVQEHCPSITGGKSSHGSPPSTSSPHFVDSCTSEQRVMLDVCSPDRLVGELFILDSSLVFAAEDLSRAPAEVLGRSSHGTSYKAALDSGHLLIVKCLRVGLVKHKKEFAKEANRIGTFRHPNIVPLRGYYWGSREGERLLIADYIDGDSLALFLHESTPRRFPRLSVSQRLKVAIDVAQCLYHLHHDRGVPHGNLKPTNIILTIPDLTVWLTDCSIHRLLTPSGITEQLLNLGALGYRAPELATSSKACPSFKADVYSFGVILVEMITGRSAGDIITGQSGAVDLPDWIQVRAREGWGTCCFDKDISGLESAPRAMEELLAISLKCILPVNERPRIRTVLEDLRSIQL